MGKKALQDNRNNFSLIYRIGTVFLIVSIFFVSVGYSSFREDLRIASTIGQIVPAQNIKVTNFVVNSSSDANSYSNSLDYTDTRINTNVHFDSATSWVKYKITVTNFGNEVAGIANYLETILPNDLTYEITDYTLKDPLCNNTNSSACTLGAQREFYITIKYKDGVTVTPSSDFQVNIGFDFQKYYSVSYTTGICTNNCPTTTIGNTSFSVTLSNIVNLEIRMNGLMISNTAFSFDDDTNTLTINDVDGDIEINNRAYTVLEYIESTGTVDNQYIDTGYVPNVNTVAVYDGMVVSGDTALFGVRQAASGLHKFTLQYIKGDYYRVSCLKLDYDVAKSYTKNVRHVFKMSSSNLYIDDVVTNAFSSSLDQSLNTLYLLAVHTANNASNFGVVRLYSFKIYENNVLQKSFIPVLDVNNRPCLYELVGKTFHYNLGGGTLNYQTSTQYTITNEMDDVVLTNSQTVINKGLEYSTTLISSIGSNLPDGLVVNSNGSALLAGTDYTYNKITGLLVIYSVLGDITINAITNQEINYLISSGPQYIDTGYVPTPNTKVVFTHVPLVARYSKWIAFFGYRQGDTNNQSFYVSSGTTNSQDKISAYVGGAHIGGDNLVLTHTTGATEVITLSADAITITVNGIEAMNIQNTDPITLDNAGSIYIFARNIGTTANYGGSIKLVSFQIYENDVLVRDFVPFKNSLGIIGLHETIQNIDYYNAGSGVFIEN